MNPGIKARQVSLDRMWSGDRRIYHFDWREIWIEFQQRNRNRLEQEEDIQSLRDYVVSTAVCSRVIEGCSYRSWVQRMVYARLTVLERLGLNYISQLPTALLPEAFNFELEPESIAVERMWYEGFTEAIRTDPSMSEYFTEEERQKILEK